MNKKKCSKLKRWLSFPQVRIFFVILFLSVLTLILAIEISNGFWSSIMSNIFAGLVTGLVLFLLSGARQIYVADLEEHLQWLKNLNNTLNEYRPLLAQYRQKHAQGEERYNNLYEILCKGNNVLEYLRWDPSNKLYGFESCQYIMKEYEIDVSVMTEHSKALYDKLRYEVLPDNDKDALDWFKQFDHDLNELHKAVEYDIENREIRLASVKRSII